MPKKKMIPDLVTDPEFESYIPPISQDELEQLEENILYMHQVIDPIVVWNRNIIVDGHNRYRIAQRHPGIDYNITVLDVDTREEVLDWICRMQLGRRNLTPEQKRFLIGRKYENEKHSHGGDRRSVAVRSSGQNDLLKSSETVRSRVAREFGVSDSYVKRAAQYADGLDMMEEVIPGIRNEVLTGARKIPEKEIEAIAKADASDREKLTRALLNGQSVAKEIRKQKAKASDRKPESVLIEMNDALETMILRWNAVLDNPYIEFTDKEIKALRKLCSTGLDFIRKLEKRWEDEDNDSD